jgi:hypothetical protein
MTLSFGSSRLRGLAPISKDVRVTGGVQHTKSDDNHSWRNDDGD